MTRSIYFIGEPGPSKAAMLKAIRDAGIEPRRVEPEGPFADKLEADGPLAIVIGAEVGSRRDLITAIRERQTLADVPIIVRAEDHRPDQVEEAIRDGADDVIVDGAASQFGAMVALLANADAWSAMRAPQGVALLAENNRSARIRLAHILRRNGYDVHFAAGTEDLGRSLRDKTPRVVVASTDIATPALTAQDEDQSARMAPWVIYGDAANGIDRRDVAQLDTIEDGEKLTFALNELLAPAPENARRTPRLLYGTSVRFGVETDSPEFHGFSYNINLGGLFIRTMTPMPKGSRVRVRFTPPHGKGEVEAVAQVVWVRKAGQEGGPMSPFGMGVQFIEWDVADRAGYEAGYGALRAEHESSLPAEADKGTASEMPDMGKIATRHNSKGVTAPPPEWWTPRWSPRSCA